MKATTRLFGGLGDESHYQTYWGMKVTTRLIGGMKATTRLIGGMKATTRFIGG